ncbi:hypothetical protein J7E91_33715 [Streptomyces sp. ISL-99]|uniref:hypothetical protein n=1 Tax=Streptomyces sp. ISL-99 TaxID=2819193 RepID=UPI001BE77FDE|nr:hypothetical protein [Streptomyces sp. ISL-99]MBT2530181.1 hypothetical protein [Streptomyces sp. ISL-99]
MGSDPEAIDRVDAARLRRQHPNEQEAIHRLPPKHSAPRMLLNIVSPLDDCLLANCLGAVAVARVLATSSSAPRWPPYVWGTGAPAVPVVQDMESNMSQTPLAPPDHPATPDEWRALVADWDSLRHGYYLGDKDEAVVRCVRHLRAEMTGSHSLLWTLGLVVLSPYVGWGNPGPGVEAPVIDVLSAVARAHEGRVCGHERHPFEPFEDDLDLCLDRLPGALEVLSNPETVRFGNLGLDDEEEDNDFRNEESALTGPELLERWHCPRNIAGFARLALDYIGG